MRKNCCVLLMILSSLFISSCVTMEPYEPYSYTGTESLYPAVYLSIAEDTSTMFKNVTFEEVDIFQNSYSMKGFQAADGLLLSTFTIDLKRLDQTLEYSVRDIYKKSTEKGWYESEVFLFFNPEMIYAHMNNQIKAIMESPELYAKAKEKAHSDLAFISNAVASMTEIQRAEFIDKEMSGVLTTATAKVSDVEENDITKYGEYKYKVDLSVDVTPDGEFQDVGIFKRWVFITLLTNNSMYSTLSKGTNVEITGQMVDFSNSGIIRQSKGSVIMIDPEQS